MTAASVILMVDRNRHNLELLNTFLGKASLLTCGISDLTDLHQFLDSGTTSVALALVDITGFDGLIWKACERMRQLDIPLLILSPRQSNTIQQQSLELGAQAVLVKPLVSRELIALIKNLMRTES